MKLLDAKKSLSLVSKIEKYDKIIDDLNNVKEFTNIKIDGENGCEKVYSLRLLWSNDDENMIVKNMIDSAKNTIKFLREKKIKELDKL